MQPAQTPGAPGPDVLDTGNPLLTPGPAALTATIVTSALTGDQALIVTVRGTSGGQTAWLSRAEAVTWRDYLDGKIAKMTTLAIPPPGGLNGGRP